MGRLAPFAGLVVRWLLLWLVLWAVVPTLLLGWRPVVITGGSMAPLIRPGDVVLVDPDRRPQVGAVVTYRDPDHGLVTHRVRAVDDDGRLRLRGDANAVDDSPVAAASVVGVGRLLVPLIGLPVVWSQQGQVVALAVASGATLLLVAPGARQRRRVRRRHRHAPALLGGPVVPLLVVAALVVPATSSALLTATTANTGSTMSVAGVAPATNLAASCASLLGLYSITLTWTPSDSPLATGQDVEVSADGGPWTVAQSLSPTADTYEQGGLDLGTYRYRIRTVTDSTLSAVSDEVLVDVGLLSCSSG